MKMFKRVFELVSSSSRTVSGTMFNLVGRERWLDAETRAVCCQVCSLALVCYRNILLW